MLAKPLSVAALSLFLISPSFAGSFLNNFMPSQQKAYPEHSASKTINNEDYTDFSGDWLGRCKNQPDDELLTIHIKNDSNNITINGQHYDINGINTNTDNRYYLTEGEHISLRWNEDRHSLLLNGVNFSQVHYSTASARLEAAIIHGTLSMDNNQLILKVFIQAYTDGEAEGTLNSSCLFTKQEN